MSLRTWLVISGSLMALGTVLAGVGLLGMERLQLPGLGVLLAGLLTYYLTARCPNCGRPLGRFPGRYCKGCGQRIDYFQKPRF